MSTDALSDREKRVLRFLPTHLSTPEIANELYLSVNTVKTHIHHVYVKLGVNSRNDAVQRARHLGLLPGSSVWASPDREPALSKVS
jgi:LuxR family maltose regulon positive regulatory protein